MTKIIIFFISFYQKYISPYKGFSCAYKTNTGDLSCSQYGKKVISRYGTLKGYQLLKRRFYDCHWHANRLAIHIKKYHYKEAGFIDCETLDCGILEIMACDAPCNIFSTEKEPICGDFMDFCGYQADSEGKFRKKRDKRNTNIKNQSIDNTINLIQNNQNNIINDKQKSEVSENE